MAITTAKGTVLDIGDSGSPVTYASIGQVRSISGPTNKVELPDVTTHDTPGFWRRKIATLIDAGDLSFKINFDAADATHAFTTGMWAALVGLVKQAVKMIFPNTAGQMLFDGYIGQHAFDVPVDNVLSAQIMLAITDEITAS
jgi:predicted secreted protein